jgi:hypothetical protein
MIIADIDGREITYSEDTEFLIQIGKGSKGKYRTKYKIIGNLYQAYFYYKSINIGNGYKKRLLVPIFNKPSLLKQVSF